MNARGIVLVTGLVFLAGVSLLALVATSGMALQRHQAANFEDQSRALAHATLAETSARNWLLSRPNNSRQAACLENCVLPVAIRNAGEVPAAPEFEAVSWWRANALEAGIHPESGAPTGVVSGMREPAFWIIEEIHLAPFVQDYGPPVFDGVGYYRILSRGAGRRPGSIAVTESIVARPWEGAFEVDSFPSSKGVRWFCGQFSTEVPCGVLGWRQRR